MKYKIIYECGCWYYFEYAYGESLVVEEYGTQFGLCDKHWKIIDDE